MVNIGFIVEGKTELFIIKSKLFAEFLLKINRTIIDNGVIDAKGNGNLIPRYTKEQIKVLQANGAKEIYVLTDSDGCSHQEVKSRIEQLGINDVFIAEQAIEAWFIADKVAIRKLLEGVSDDDIEHPESHQNPYEYIKFLANKLELRGVGSKRTLVKRMVDYFEFSVENAATHPNCPSAKYMVDILTRSC